MNFDPCPPVWPLPPRDRPGDDVDAMPRPYAGRKRKGPGDDADPDADARAEVEGWAEVGREFMAPRGQTPEHRACLFRWAAAMFARALAEAEALGVAASDPDLAAGLARDGAGATELGESPAGASGPASGGPGPSGERWMDDDEGGPADAWACAPPASLAE